MTAPAQHRRRASDRRRRRIGRLVALALVLFSSPMLPGWWALAAQGSYTRMVELCTAEGMRLVSVPADDAAGPAHGQDQALAGLHCVACPLGACPGIGAACCPPSVIAQLPAAVPIDPVAVDFSVRRPASSRLGPPTRAPPVS